MNNDGIKKLRGAVKEEIETALKPIDTKLNRVEKKVDILWEQVEKVTFGLEKVKETLGVHTDVLKRIEAKIEKNSDNIHKLNKRVVTVEGKLGIASPPELTVY